MSNLLVSGCSIAHGCELYTGFNHPENIRLSWSQRLADRLGVNLTNLSLCGGSNDYIFFSLMEELINKDDWHAVMVSWTSINRISWQYQNRFWLFNPVWATSITKNDDGSFSEWFANEKCDNVSYNSDRPEDIDQLKTAHKFFTNNYFDDSHNKSRLRSYSTALQSVCQEKAIRLIQTTPFPKPLPSIYQYGQNLSFMQQGRHPILEEHISIADEIFNKFFV